MALNDSQRNDIRNFLLSRGLAFKPLLDEMLDHVACDLEELMNNGLSYHDAWKQTINQLPEDHFIQIQKETMETINHRFMLSRVFTYAGMAALVGSIIFKIMHLAGANELLLAGIGALGISLISGSVAGIYFNRDKRGAIHVVSIVAGVILVQLGYVFRILHLPGGSQLLTLAVIVLLVTMVVNTLYVHANASGSGNLFTFLHDKYAPGIERFLLLISPLMIFGTLKLVHVIIVFAAGLQTLALIWSKMEKDTSKNDGVTLTTVIIACICLSIPMLGELVDYHVRLVLVTLFSFVGAFLAFRLEPSKSLYSYLVCIVPIMFFMLALMKMNLMTSFGNNIALNVIVAGTMIVAIYLSPKTSITRTYMILSLAGYLIEM